MKKKNYRFFETLSIRFSSTRRGLSTPFYFPQLATTKRTMQLAEISINAARLFRGAMIVLRFLLQSAGSLGDSMWRVCTCLHAKMRPDATSAGDASSRFMCETNGADESETLCIVCATHSKSRVFEPCMHVCACDACADRLDRCPLCQRPIFAKRRVYLN